MASAAASLDPSTMVQITTINHLEELASVSTKILILISTLASLLKADGWTDGSMDGWTDGQINAWMDGQMVFCQRNGAFCNHDISKMLELIHGDQRKETV